MRFKSSFSLMALVIHKRTWLKIIKGLFGKKLWNSGHNLLVLELSIVSESLVISAYSRMESSYQR